MRIHTPWIGAVTAAATAIVVALLTVAAPLRASAHPIGNFTINQYVAVHVEPDLVEIDMVIDRAEIPASQLLDGAEPDAAMLEDLGSAECGQAVGGIVVTVGGVPIEFGVERSVATTPEGAGGLLTVRIECLFSADASLAEPTTVVVENRNFEDRLGWAEIVVTAIDLDISTDLGAESVTDRLLEYPDDLLASPPDIHEAEFSVSPSPGTVRGERFDPAAASSSERGLIERTGDRFSSLLDEAAGGAGAVIASLGVAFVLGAGHAMAPGHGKTVMAASLVGTRGRPRHAFILGTSVAISHTLGVLVLGVITFAASSAFAPERVFPYLAAVSGIIVASIGAWIIAQWIRTRRHGAQHAGEAHADHHHGGDHHGGEGHTHSHGGRSHTHAVIGDREITWKLLATLGLSGGLVPSVSAILLLLAAINLGRIGLGLILILMFGIGMAVTLVGVGIAVVIVGERGLDRFGGSGWGSRLRAVLAPVAGAVVLVVGVVLTARAVVDILG